MFVFLPQECAACVCVCLALTCSADEDAGGVSFLLFNVLQVVLHLLHRAAKRPQGGLMALQRLGCVQVSGGGGGGGAGAGAGAEAYLRKSRTSSMVRSPVESRVRSAQLRGESSGASTEGEDRLLGGSALRPAEETSAQRLSALSAACAAALVGGSLHVKTEDTRKRFTGTSRLVWMIE